VSEREADDFTVDMQDASNQNDGNYVGTITFQAVKDGQVTPCDCFDVSPHNAGDGNAKKYTYVPADDGPKQFTLTWKDGAKGDYTFSVLTDLGDETGDSETVHVVDDAATKVEIATTGDNAVDKHPIVGQPDAVKITLTNAQDDIDKNYSLPVDFGQSTCGTSFYVTPHDPNSSTTQDPSKKVYTFTPADQGEKVFNITWVEPENGCTLKVRAQVGNSVATDSVSNISPELGATTTTTPSTTTSSTSTTSTTLPPPAHEAVYVTGAMAGGAPHVLVRRQSDNTVVRSFYAYDPNFHGGVNVAFGDVNDDGYKDIVTAAGPGGGPHVKVFSGKDNSTLASFYAYNTGLANGVNVAVGDVNGDGKADIITGPNAQPGWGPHVKAFSGILNSVNQADTGYQAPTLVASFFAYDVNFTGGIRVASADTDNDGKAEIVTGAGVGGGPHVRIFKSTGSPEAAPTQLYNSFLPGIPGTFTGGLYVAASKGEDNKVHVIVSTGPGMTTTIKSIMTPDGETATNFTIGDTRGASVALGQLDGDAPDELAVATASGISTVRRYDLPQTAKSNNIDAYPGFGNGATIAIGVI
jgi:hypothetical protein